MNRINVISKQEQKEKIQTFKRKKVIRHQKEIKYDVSRVQERSGREK